MVKKTIFMLFVLTSISKIGLASGFSDWSAFTKYQTHFFDPGGGLNIILKNGETYEYPNKWYFYKSHIIGKRNKWIDGKYRTDYFVINEKEGEILEFTEEEKWNNYLILKKLVPSFWTRWFISNWNHLETLALYSIFFFPFSIMIILLNCFLFFKAIRVDNFNLKGKWTKTAFIFPVIIFSLFILGKFPQSF